MPASDTPEFGRLFLPSLSDLIDRLTVDQIKEVLQPANREAIADEIKRLENDIDLATSKLDLKATARFLRKVIVLAQINLHIWYNKDQMQVQPDRYAELLTMAHQLNGIRNRIKNSLLDETGDEDEAARHTNVSTDGLEGWEISI